MQVLRLQYSGVTNVRVHTLHTNGETLATELLCSVGCVLVNCANTLGTEMIQTEISSGITTCPLKYG